MAIQLRYSNAITDVTTDKDLHIQKSPRISSRITSSNFKKMTILKYAKSKKSSDYEIIAGRFLIVLPNVGFKATHSLYVFMWN